METKYRDQIEAIIQEMVEADPGVINAVITDEVTKRLGEPIRKEKVAQIKRDMGLGTYALMANNIVNDLAGMAKISPSTSEYNLQDLALLMAVTCVRNTVIEKYHDDGKLSSAEMKAFNIEVSSKIYTMLEFLLNPEHEADRDIFMTILSTSYPENWQKPVLNEGMMKRVQREKAWASGTLQ